MPELRLAEKKILELVHYLALEVHYYRGLNKQRTLVLLADPRSIKM